ncbi:MAG: hypothetical protein AAF414_21515 [Pseudomonadota bacterium]
MARRQRQIRVTGFLLAGAALVFGLPALAGDYVGTQTASNASDGGDMWVGGLRVSIQDGRATVVAGDRSWTSPATESPSMISFDLGFQTRQFLDTDGDGVFTGTWQAEHRGVLRNYLVELRAE